MGGISGLFLGLFILKTSEYMKILRFNKYIFIGASIIGGLILLPLLFIVITALPYGE